MLICVAMFTLEITCVVNFLIDLNDRFKINKVLKFSGSYKQHINRMNFHCRKKDLSKCMSFYF